MALWQTLLSHYNCYWRDFCCCRMYAIRRIKDGFRMHKNESDKATIEQLIIQAENNYEVIQRQVTHLQCTLCLKKLFAVTSSAVNWLWKFFHSWKQQWIICKINIFGSSETSLYYCARHKSLKMLQLLYYYKSVKLCAYSKSPNKGPRRNK